MKKNGYLYVIMINCLISHLIKFRIISKLLAYNIMFCCVVLCVCVKTMRLNGNYIINNNIIHNTDKCGT